MPRNPLRRVRESQGLLRIAPFFFALQGAFETATMHADPEAPVNLLHALRCCESRVCGLQRQDVLEHLARKLVAPLRTAQLRHQPGEALLGEGRLCMVEEVHLILVQ